VLVRPLGNHSALTQLGRTYVAVAEQFQDARGKVKAIKDSVFVTWAGAASRSYERAFDVALGRCQYAPRGLQAAADALYRYAGELVAAQDAHDHAVAQIAVLQADYAIDQTNMALETQLRHHVNIASNAQAKAVQAANTFAAAMSSCTTTEWYAIPPRDPRFDSNGQLVGGFDAITAAVMDSLVAHQYMHPNDALLVAQRLETLSAADYQTFMNAEATASTDAERGNLYKALAGGQPVSVFTAPPPPPVVISNTVQPISPPRPHPNITGGAAPTPPKPNPHLHHTSGGGG
jgi:hypothetical protein